MIKSITNCLVLLFFSVSLSYAQTGIISGSVKTSDGKPAELVTINIKGIGKTALTDKKGKYQLKGIKPGTYGLIATFIGLVKQEQTVKVNAGATTAADFILNENADQLEEVIISSRNANKVTAAVAKMPLKNLENPQVYNVVPTEVLKQQVITSYDDAMRNVPGINRTWESTGRGGDGGSYFALRGFDAQPNLINGLPGLTSGNMDVANVEEIQVIKGPSATLFGASFYGYGGVINTITKKPYYTTGGEVAYNIGSFGLHRVTVDVNTPLSKTEKIALRLNASYHKENSFQNAGFKKSYFVSPALVYEVNYKLKFDLMAEIYHEKRAVPPVFFHSDRATALPFTTVEDLNLNVKESFTSNSLTMNNPRSNIQAQMNYKLSDQWNSQTVVSAGWVKSDGYYTYIFDDSTPDNFFPQDITRENNNTRTIDVQQNFNGDFKIAGIRNRLLVGLDYFNRNVINKGTNYATARYVTPQGNSVDFTTPGPDPVEYVAVPQLTKSYVDGLLTHDPDFDTDISNSSYSAYVSDVVNITSGFSAMLSLRTDYFVSPGDKEDDEDNFNQFALSQKLGLVYQPILDKISFFANYMNAFVNVAPGSVYDMDGNPTGEIQSFKPEHANQLEFGIKTNLLSDRLSATLSYYNIKISDRVYTDPVNPNNQIQGGKVKSRGFEIDVNANLVSGLTLLAGYSHNSSKVLKGSNVDFYNEPGRAPGGQGPADQVNLWANYKFEHGTFKNFGLGLGGNYAGKYVVIDNSVTGVFELPSYTLLNGTVSYNCSKFRVAFNASNITNEQYYIGYWSINPQRQRSFAGSIAFKF
ncbi:TonB-dependent receptor [Pedobacter heparinus]|uniref:TonB-dependent receptor n=1 Tax=Pedobacter heparinus TaxID=984 RepID=UPI00293080C6|nr:TonB-dependent receptor [Pedobacter heparinus]